MAGIRMARGNAEAKRKGEAHAQRPPLKACVKPGDPIPSFFLQYLQSLQSQKNDKQVTGARPAKRQRTSPDADFVTILRDEVVISTRNDGSSAASGHIHLVNAASDLKFDLNISKKMGATYNSWTLGITPCITPGTFLVDFLVDRSAFPDWVHTILGQDYDVSWSNPGTEDSIWCSTSISMEESPDILTLKFTFSAHWNISTTTLPSNRYLQLHQSFRTYMLQTAFPDKFRHIGASEEKASCSPQVFYKAAFVPGIDDTPPERLRIQRLAASLYPFQRRAVKWMLQREGVRWGEGQNDGDSIVYGIDGSPELPSSFFTEIRDVDGKSCHISPVLAKITKDLGPFILREQDFKGGILAEEMGLGKTVEIVSLILLHPRPSFPQTQYDRYLGEDVQPTGATLIVAPHALKDQWVSELKKHAPELRVLFYPGVGKRSRRKESADALLQELSSQDVVITTYNVLTSELPFAENEPDRARRAPRKYDRPKSPLTRLQWWRLALDEIQMISGGLTQAAKLGRMIPRVNAWGVTGTPVIKDSVEDLRGLLLFLRYEPFASNIQAWNTLVNSFPESFAKLFNSISMRHTKRFVGHEISIPTQKRYVITMPFTAVEEQHYQSLFQELTNMCGLNTSGEPLSDWDPNDPGVLSSMRSALDRLRMTALHPEIGPRNRRALGLNNRPMRTVAEVLDAMLEQSELAIRSEHRLLLQTSLKRGQLLENSPRVRTALAIWQEVSEAIGTSVQECRRQLQYEIDQAKAAGKIGDGGASEEESDEDIDDMTTGRLGDARRRLRSALEIQHKAVFFIANGYFQIKSNEEMTEPGSDEFRRLEQLETEGYELAKIIRREILEESRRKATRLMDRISNTALKQNFAVIPEFRSLSQKGIESRRIVEDLEELGAALNEQAETVDDLREMIVQLLIKPLVDEDDEAEAEITGKEYADSATLMETTIVVMTVLRACVADREDAFSGQTNELVRTEIKGSVDLAKEDEGPDPQKLLQLVALRDQVKPRAGLSLRRVVADLRALSIKLRQEASSGSNRARMELDIVLEQLKGAQKQLTEQQKVTTTMSGQEMDLFTAAMNARVEYYRQLQAISDSVDPYEGPKDDHAMEVLAAQEHALERRLETAEAKHRYLVHLKEDDKDEDQRMCIICRETFTVGVLTLCGHKFCKGCIMLWFKAHHNCPVCKKQLSLSNLHNITLRPQELRVQAESASPAQPKAQIRASSSKKSTIYTEFDPTKLAEIKSIELNGPAFTTKVDHLVRHLMWLRESDPGAKSIIFSQYPEFLKVVALALERYRIGHTFFEKSNGITEFKNNPAVEVFLLHARAHASGLNLVHASHVFLCEPLLNPALELQAIARVHRIGQQQETTVWLSIVEGTVEESIYNLSVQRRMEHIGDQDKGKGKGKSNESTPGLSDDKIEGANAQAMEQSSLSKLMGKGRTAGEAIQSSDLWTCLFGNVARSQENEDEHLRNNPAVRGFLAAEAAEERRQDGPGPASQDHQPLILVNGV